MYENLITKVSFQRVGIDNFNRQQLAEITQKTVDEKIELRVGQEISLFNSNLRISEIVFTLMENYNPVKRKIDVFSEFDSSEPNCVVTVFLENAD